MQQRRHGNALLHIRRFLLRDTVEFLIMHSLRPYIHCKTAHVTCRDCDILSDKPFLLDFLAIFRVVTKVVGVGVAGIFRHPLTHPWLPLRDASSRVSAPQNVHDH